MLPLSGRKATACSNGYAGDARRHRALKRDADRVVARSSERGAPPSDNDPIAAGEFMWTIRDVAATLALSNRRAPRAHIVAHDDPQPPAEPSPVAVTIAPAADPAMAVGVGVMP